MKIPQILLIEDDESLRSLIERRLKREGYQVTAVETAEEAWELLQSHRFSLSIVDVMLPGMDGWTLARLIREDPVVKSMPLLFLTARSLDVDILKGFELGCDDYVTKPFRMDILLARIQALLRRTGETKEGVVKEGPLVLNPALSIAYLHNTALSLTPAEFSILYLLISRSPQPLTRETLLETISHDDATLRTVDVHIAHLRKKLGSLGNCIKTIRKRGYVWEKNP